MRAIKLILLVVTALVVLILSLQNRHMVVFQWDPFADQAVDPVAGFVQLPMFLYVIIALMVGIAIGVFLEWRREAKHRSTARSREAEIGKLRGEVNKLYSAGS